MAIKPHLPLDERLLTLRKGDQFRTWSSLDDKRTCVLCEKSFSGRQVAISRDRNGGYSLHCPTEGCNAGPSQWVYPGNPLTSDAAYRDWQRALVESERRSPLDEPTSAAA